MNLDLKYNAAVFWRRFPYFIVVASLLTSLGLILAIILPPAYEARAKLLVEQEQIPQDLASSTVRTNALEQLQIIEQRLMTRGNLLETANRLGVYANRDPEDGPMSASDIVDDMRARTTFERQTGRNTATTMTISFRAPTSALAAQVTNEFVTLVLRENVEMRTSRAGDTLEFFEQEVERLSGELSTQSARILEFRNANADALPTSLNFLQGREATLEERLAQIDRDVTSLTEQRTRIIEIFERTGQLAATGPRTPEQEALDTARRQLDDALLIYAPSNPRVRVLENKVALLEERAAARAAKSDDEDSGEGTLLDAQLVDIDGKIERLEEEKVSIAERLEETRAALQRIPANTNVLQALERDQQNIQAQYNRAAERLSVAATGERIELLSKGQRITVIEQATAPQAPTTPNRPLIAAGGVGAGIVFGLGVVLLLELLNRSIRRPIELTTRLGITPLAVLPYVRTDRERFINRAMTMGLVILFIIVVPVALYMVHMLAYPLDTVFEGIANSLGFSLSSDPAVAE